MAMQTILRLAACALALTLAAPFVGVSSSPASAQDVELPYWASIDTEVANMRVGAGEQFPIEWVYRREGLPVRVVRIMQGWRYVEEPDGTRGWISSGLLSLERTAIVTGEELAAIRSEPSANAPVLWNLEPGVVGRVSDCTQGWCEFDVEGHKGWVLQDRLWGAGEP